MFARARQPVFVCVGAVSGVVLVLDKLNFKLTPPPPLPRPAESLQWS